MEDFQKRVLDEQTDLEGNIYRLNSFMLSRTFDELPVEDRDLLDSQYGVMCDYKDILTRRIARFPATP